VELPDWLQGPLDAVLRDLQQPERVAFAIRWEPPEDDDEPGMLWFSETGDVSGFGISLFPMLDPEEQKAMLAEHLPDHLAETAGAWGQGRPACPGHAHPATADVLDGVAVWLCPRDGRMLARIGEL
jgi:hypothetical protein